MYKNNYDSLAPIYGAEGNGLPLRVGYRPFAKGCEVTAWERLSLPGQYDLDRTHFGADNGLMPKLGGCPVTTDFTVGERGEAVYTVKTVYTDITVDGVKDPAYDYGVHLRGAVASKPEYYKGRNTRIDVYIVRGQDGHVYVYGEVTDPDIVVEDDIYNWKTHYCDGLHAYLEYGNFGVTASTLGLITPDESGAHRRGVVPGCVLKLTDSGFCFEYSFDNQGHPFVSDDSVSFGFYYNDTNDYIDSNNYHRAVVKLPSRLNPEGTPYVEPTPKLHDGIVFSEDSATGAFAAKHDLQISKTGDLLADILSGAASVKVVYPGLCSAHSVLCAKEIFRTIRACGGNAVLVCEKDDAKTDCSILVDCVDLPESKALTESADYNGYALAIGQNTVTLAGRLEDQLSIAKELFLSALDYVKNGGKTSHLDKLYKGEISSVINAPEMDGLTTVTDAGDNAYLLLKQNASPEDFDSYAQKLLGNGYTLYTENQMTTVRCATYVSDKTIVNLTYGSSDTDRSLRAVVDSRAMTSLPPLTKDSYIPVCSSTVTQLCPKSVAWMCYVIKQDNGEYFIIDAGGNVAHKYIFDTLMKMSGGEDVVVSCWLFTHFHCDHIGGFIEFTDRDEYLKKVSVKSVILNFPQWQVLDTSSPFDHKNLDRWHGVVEKCGATVYQARTGQKYYFGNVELEMLFTYEDLMPFSVFVDRTNPTSHIFSMTIDGQRFIMTGDACGEATRLVAQRYGGDMKADFVQLPHHGFGDGGTALEFYELIDAPWVLYPGTGHGASRSEQWACDHARKYFLNIDRDTVIPIPYNGEEI